MSEQTEVKIGKQVSLQTLMQGVQTVVLLGSIAGAFLMVGRRDAAIDNQAERMKELAAITADLARTADSIQALQLPNGMIPWYPNGHCDPWNHVETAMALNIMGRDDAALAAYNWLANNQHEDGWWFNYYMPDGTIEDSKLDTNVNAYIAVGVWTHWLCTRDTSAVHALWPTVRRALNWVLDMRREDGAVIWAREVDSQPWGYALLTGCSSIRHALRCGAALADLLGDPQPEWTSAAER